MVPHDLERLARERQAALLAEAARWRLLEVARRGQAGGRVAHEIGRRAWGSSGARGAALARVTSLARAVRAALGSALRRPRAPAPREQPA